MLLAAAYPADNAGIAAGQYAFGQRHRGHVDQFIAQPEVVEQDAEKALPLAQVQVGAGAADQQQHGAWQQFDIAHAQRAQAAVRDPGNKAVGPDPRRGPARQFTRAGRGRVHVVDSYHLQPVPVARLAHAFAQPVAVGQRHLTIGICARVEALVKRLGRHRADQRRDARQQLEAAVEHELAFGIAALEFLHDGDHRVLLRGARGVGAGKELIGVERVKEKAAPAALPQGSNDGVEKKRLPAGSGLVYHPAAPGGVAAAQAAGRQAGVIRTGRMHFAQRHVGIQLVPTVGRRARMAARVGDKVRLDHGDVECLQFRQRRLRAIVKGDAGRTLLRQRQHRHATKHQYAGMPQAFKE